MLQGMWYQHRIPIMEREHAADEGDGDGDAFDTLNPEDLDEVTTGAGLFSDGPCS
jgi:hypothetical protein